MKDYLLNIVAVIVRQMSQDDGVDLMDQRILDSLLEEGYDLLEIDDALSWLESLSGGAEDMGGVEVWPGFKGIRMPAHWEKESMTPEAFIYLMKLNEAGIVGDSLREAVMDKVAELSMPGFGIEQMRALLGLVLYSRKNMEPEEAFEWRGNLGQGSVLN